MRIEKKIFPKHESLVRILMENSKRRILDYSIAGYIMYSWPSSLCACITKFFNFCFLILFFRSLLLHFVDVISTIFSILIFVLLFDIYRFWKHFHTIIFLDSESIFIFSVKFTICCYLYKIFQLPVCHVFFLPLFRFFLLSCISYLFLHWDK